MNDMKIKYIYHRKYRYPLIYQNKSSFAASSLIRDREKDIEHAIELRKKKTQKTDFYFKLDTLAKRVKDFVGMLGSKYDLQHFNRGNGNESYDTQNTFLDEISTYNNIDKIK